MIRRESINYNSLERVGCSDCIAEIVLIAGMPFGVNLEVFLFKSNDQ